MASCAWLSTERTLAFLILELLACTGLLVIPNSGLVYILGELAFLKSFGLLGFVSCSNFAIHLL